MVSWVDFCKRAAKQQRMRPHAVRMAGIIISEQDARHTFVELDQLQRLPGQMRFEDVVQPMKVHGIEITWTPEPPRFEWHIKMPE